MLKWSALHVVSLAFFFLCGHCILDVDLRILSACIDYWAFFFFAPEHGAIGALLGILMLLML
jgi:hypothetical protein